MTNHIRAKLEALISDSSMFNAGQLEERRRLQLLLTARVDELRSGPTVPQVSAICAELLRIRQALEPC
jgi:hypothetical protein